MSLGGVIIIFLYSEVLVAQNILGASCLTLEMKEFRCYEVKIEESEKAISHRESNTDTSGLSRQCSATEP